jgi:hypothetical protein
MGLKPDHGMTLRRLWAGGWLFSNMSFTASILTHARSIIFMKQIARKNVSSTSRVNFFASGLCYCCWLPGVPGVFWLSETLEKRLLYYSWNVAKIFLENRRIDSENYD